MPNILEHCVNKCSAIYWVSSVLTHSYFLISGNSKRSKMLKCDIPDNIKQDYLCECNDRIILVPSSRQRSFMLVYLTSLFSLINPF